MSELYTFLVLMAIVLIPPFLMQLWWNRKISKREEKPGDLIDEAYEQGPAEMDEDVLEYKKRELEETDRNILQLGEREILAFFGMGRVPHLGVESIEHKMGEPVVQVVLYENIYKWYGIPVGFERTRVRDYSHEIPIVELDEMLGEEVIAVEDNNGFLKAMGISAYEDREYEDYDGHTVREYVVRTWNEDANNRWGVEYQLEQKREKIIDEPVEWGLESDFQTGEFSTHE